MKIIDCIDRVCGERIIPKDIYEFSKLRKTRLFELCKSELASEIASYLLENDYIEIKEDKVKEGLLVRFELFVLDRKKLKVLKKGGKDA